MSQERRTPKTWPKNPGESSASNGAASTMASCALDLPSPHHRYATVDNQPADPGYSIRSHCSSCYFLSQEQQTGSSLMELAPGYSGQRSMLFHGQPSPTTLSWMTH